MSRFDREHNSVSKTDERTDKIFRIAHNVSTMAR